ncbi:hypothetical protein ADICEAN_03404 [Cesiribacter andamanensis AMV16]|uniref:Uncharacterized protein n=2 Tax=Cesiribacter TaxID=1133570 RepID=M7MYE7_9BACT|nr:hypothetical protein ADICEAN_03404 [Cesiribacter andamanensis AMV16]
MLLFLVFYSSVRAQAPIASDSLTAYSNTILLYRNMIRENSRLYSGREYVPLSRRIQGHAFYASNDWAQGSLVYWGEQYEQVPLLYDILSDELVIRHYDSSFRIKLIADKITAFSIYNHHFIRLEPPRGAPLAAGFYDQLYKGGTLLLAKRRKTILETRGDGQVKQEFEQNDQYYIFKEGTYYPVSKRGAVLKVLKDKRKEVKRMMKQNKVLFWQNPEYAMIKMLEFYDLAKTAAE